ncbi:uncharacterized protein [Venturia canescens]|uniref:uncharacterized protein isoform X2 n=1 Tax=Venturia canescens TaxID=32260 RepID=UPI001C9C2679|nr:uncharacterized protein LOC122413593 isoform X2 [Venturia canescens]
MNQNINVSCVLHAERVGGISGRRIPLVLVCSLMSLAHGSLEPAGYRPPGTHPQTRYLPPSSSNHRTNNRYTSSSPNVSGQNVAELRQELSSSFSLPLQKEPLPFSNYLPANRQSSDPSEHQSSVENRWNSAKPSYEPSREIQPSLTEAIPLNNYLPLKDELSSSELYPPIADKSNFASDPTTSHLPSTFSSHHDFLSREAQSGVDSAYRQVVISDKLSSRYGYQNSGSSGYRYPSSEHQEPAKYQFEYEVKDHYGNDYGHKETRNGENTQGVYKVLLPDGRRQVVHYEADSHGYRPIITYEEAESGSYPRQSTTLNNHGYQY